MNKNKTILIIAIIISVIIIGTIAGYKIYESRKLENRLLTVYISNIGGESNFRMLENRYCLGTLTTKYRTPDSTYTTVEKFEAYGFSDSRTFLTYYDNSTEEKIWVESNLKNYNEANQDDTISHREVIDYFLNPQAPLMFKKYFPNLEIGGPGVSPESENNTFVLLSSLKDPDYLEFFFGSSLGLQFDYSTFVLIGIGRNWVISDYREIDNVLVPHFISGHNSERSFSYQFDSIKHNLEIDDSIFETPTGK